MSNSLKKKTADSLAPDERQKLATLAKDMPSFDVRINFEYNSDNIGPAAAQAIKDVGKALSNSQLSGNTFIIAGHTDGKGSDDYNQRLSERRAEAVKRYLSEKYKIFRPKLWLPWGTGKQRSRTRTTHSHPRTAASKSSIHWRTESGE